MAENYESLILFKTGFICARFSTKPVPSTMDEVYDILKEVGLDIIRGEHISSIDKKLNEFLKQNCLPGHITLKI